MVSILTELNFKTKYRMVHLKPCPNTKVTKFLTWSAKCRVINKARASKTENMTMRCLVRIMTWLNGGNWIKWTQNIIFWCEMRQFLQAWSYFFQIALQLYSRGWMDPFPDPLLLRKSGSAGNRTQDLWMCNQELLPLGHRDGPSGERK
jgi:hypothetical protein